MISLRIKQRLLDWAGGLLVATVLLGVTYHGACPVAFERKPQGYQQANGD